MNLQNLITKYCFICAWALLLGAILLSYGLGYNSGLRDKIVIENKITCKTISDLLKPDTKMVKTIAKESK